MKHTGWRKGRNDGMKGEDHPMWQHLKGLGLDEKQKEAVRAIRAGDERDDKEKSG